MRIAVSHLAERHPSRRVVPRLVGIATQQALQAPLLGLAREVGLLLLALRLVEGGLLRFVERRPVAAGIGRIGDQRLAAGILARQDLGGRRIGRGRRRRRHADQRAGDDDCAGEKKTRRAPTPSYNPLFRAPEALHVVCPEGLEPPTCCLEGNCSIQLSYGQRGPSGDERSGRGGGIRTRDLLVPNQLRYQAALRPEPANCRGDVRSALVSATRRRWSARAASAGARSRRTAGCAARRRSAATSR